MYNFRVFGDFVPKKQTKKFDKIHKDFELYQVFMPNVLGQNARVFALYIYITYKKKQYILIDG